MDLSHNTKLRELWIPTSRINPDDPNGRDWLVSVLSTVQSEVINELHMSVYPSWYDAEHEKLDTVISTDPRFKSLKTLVLHIQQRRGSYLDEENFPRFPQFSARGKVEIQ